MSERTWNRINLWGATLFAFAAVAYATWQHVWTPVPLPANWLLAGIIVLSTAVASLSVIRGETSRVVGRMMPALYVVTLVQIYDWSIDSLLGLPAEEEYIGWLVYLGLALIVLPVCGVLTSLTLGPLKRDQVDALVTVCVMAPIVLVLLALGADFVAKTVAGPVYQDALSGVGGIVVLIAFGGSFGLLLHRWRDVALLLSQRPQT